MMISLLRTLIGMDGAVGFAILLYHFSIFELGPPLIAFFFNLIFMGWSVGLEVCGLVLRFGLGAESLAWFLIFAFAPVSCIYISCPNGSYMSPKRCPRRWCSKACGR